MSNVTTGNPWILDTAGVITTKLLWVQKFVFVPNASDDDLIVKDNAGEVVWQIRAVAGSPNNESVGMEEFRPSESPMCVSGLNLDTIDGGSLRVYLR